MLVNVDSLPSTSSQAIEHYLVLIALYMCVDYVFYSNVNYAFSFFFVLQASISLDKECTLLKLQNGQQKNQITAHCILRREALAERSMAVTPADVDIMYCKGALLLVLLLFV